MNCPPSAKLASGIVRKQSKYAYQGEVAHAMAELICKKRLRVGGLTDQAFNSQLASLESKFPGNEGREAREWVLTYVNFVFDRYTRTLKECPSAELLTEMRVDFSDIVPGGFGTSDNIILSDGTMEIFDFKFGTGVKVEAVGNPQMRLYAWGALEANRLLYDIKKVRMTIHQPRIAWVSTEELTVEELYDYMINEVKPKAVLAYKGEGEYKSGDWCTFCNAKHVCADLSGAVRDFEEKCKNRGPLTLQEKEDLLEFYPVIKTVMNEIEEELSEACSNGTQLSKFKQVTVKGHRKIEDEEALEDLLLGMGFYGEQFSKRSFKSIKDLEKLLGEHKDLLDDFVVRHEKAKLVLKKELKGSNIASAIEDFE